MRHVALSFFALSCLSLIGCPSDEPEPREDAGVTADAGETSADAGGAAADAGVDDDAGAAPVDAGGQNDAGVPELACGNGVVDVGEDCDDGNDDDGDDCQSNCTDSRCGDGSLRTNRQAGEEGFEECDDGNDVPGDGIGDTCDPDCTIVAAPEEDDHGNDAENATELRIGVPVEGAIDGAQDMDYFGFDVETTLTFDILVTSTAPLNCRLEDSLGTPLDEQISDPEREGNCAMVARLDGGERYYVVILVVGDNLPTYTLTITARDEALCGNGELEGDEECDDNNLIAGDGCDPDCRTEAVCGNGILEGLEDCDDGNNDDGDGCENCRVVDVVLCGNGRIDGDEGCDDGNREAGDGCDADCGIEGNGEPQCGNEVLERGEQCDDGVNGNNEDGCDDQCQFVGNPNDDHGDEMATATEIAAPSNTGGVIEVGLDVDWFTFTLEEEGVWNIHTTGDMDTRCWLFNGEGVEIAYNDDLDVFEDNLNCGMVRRFEAGTWYVQIRTWDAEVGDYTLVLVESDEEIAEDDHGNVHEDATSVEVPSRTVGALEVGGDVDVFTFTVPEAGFFRMYTRGDLDTRCTVHGNAEPIENDDAWNVFDNDLPFNLGVNCGILTELVAGTTYYLSIRGFDEGVMGPYTAHVEAHVFGGGGGCEDDDECGVDQICDGGQCVDEGGEEGPTICTVTENIFGAICSGCHGGEFPSGNLSLTNVPSDNYDALVGVASSMGMNYVEPGNVFDSYIIHKLQGTLNDLQACQNGDCGARMPRGGPYLSDEEMETIIWWIETGDLTICLD